MQARGKRGVDPLGALERKVLDRVGQGTEAPDLAGQEPPDREVAVQLDVEAIMLAYAVTVAIPSRASCA